MFENLFGGKSWYKSLTAISLLVIAIAEVLAQSGLVPQQYAEYLQMLGGLGTALGIRKAATAPNAV